MTPGCTGSVARMKWTEHQVFTTILDCYPQLHVHSVPEHTFDVEARPGQVFEFTVDVPGRVDVELHDLGRIVVTIHVRP
jgi:hypothetical protein